MLAIAATSSASAAGVSAQLRAGRAQDGCVAHVGPWCFLRDRIPCHDTSCQLPTHPDLNCTQLTDEQYSSSDDSGSDDGSDSSSDGDGGGGGGGGGSGGGSGGGRNHGHNLNGAAHGRADVPPLQDDARPLMF